MSARGGPPERGRARPARPFAVAVVASLLTLAAARSPAAQPPGPTVIELRTAVEALGSSDPATWRRAMRVLVGRGEKAVPALREALRGDRRSAVQARAARLLGDLGATAAAADLRALLADVKADPSVRRESGRALGRLRDGAARDLLVAYLDTDPEIATRALAALGDDVVIPDLLERLARPQNGASQVLLGEALCRLGARSGVDLLLEAAFRPEGAAVLQAIRALKSCLDPTLTVPQEVVPDRTQIYRLQLRWNRECTTMPLRVGPARPSAALRRRAAVLVGEALAEPSAPRARARQILLTAMRDAAAPALVAVFGTDLGVAQRAVVVRMLVEMGPYAVAALLEGIEGRHPGVVRGSLETMAALPVQGWKFPALHGLLVGAERGVLEVLYRGDLEDPGARVAAMDLLGWIGAEAAGFALAAVLRDAAGEPPAVRLAAARGLGLAGAAASGRPALWRVVEDGGETRALRCEAAFALALLLEPRGVGRLVAWLDQGGEPIPYLRRLSGWTWFGHEVEPEAAVRRWQRWWAKYAAVIRVDVGRVKRELLWDRENVVFRADLEQHWLGGLGSQARWIDRVDQEARCLALAIRMLPTLARMVAQDPDRWRRFHAVQMMSILGARRGVPALVDALDDCFELVRSTAAEGLGIIGRDFEYEDYAAALRSALRPLLTDPDAGCRAQAALALARLHFADGVEVLIDLMDQGDPAVVDFAWTAYRRITGKRDFDFNPAATTASRRRAVAAMRSWWAREGAAFRPHVPREPR